MCGGKKIKKHKNKIHFCVFVLLCFGFSNPPKVVKNALFSKKCLID